MDWEKASQHLKEIETALNQSPIFQGLRFMQEIVKGLRLRLDNGERTQDLYTAIMELI